MKNISRFNQFFESKKLHNAGIPESIFSFLFKEKLFRNNDVDLEEIKTKKELKQIIRHEHILAIKDEDNFIFIHKEWDYHVDGKLDSSQFNNRLSLTSTLALITKEYKIYKVLNNNKIYKKYKKHENTGSLSDVDEKTLNLVKKHLKKLRKIADTELIESLNDYRYSEVLDKYNPKQPVMTTDTIAAIYNINTMIYDFNNNDSNSFYKLLKLFNENLLRDEESKRLNNNTTSIRQIIFEKVSRIINQWEVSDFYGFHSSRDLLTRKEKRMKKSKSFNL